MALTVAACGGADDAPEDTRVTTTVETTTTTQPTPEEEAESVYLELFDTVIRLLTTDQDPDDPDLARLAMDPVLGTFRDSLTTMRSENHIVERGTRTSQTVISVESTTADTVKLRACSVGNDTTIDQDDGSIIDQGLSTRLVEVTIRLSGGEWKVSDIATVERFEGEVPCPR